MPGETPSGAIVDLGHDDVAIETPETRDLNLIHQDPRISGTRDPRLTPFGTHWDPFGPLRSQGGSAHTTMNAIVPSTPPWGCVYIAHGCGDPRDLAIQGSGSGDPGTPDLGSRP